MYFFCGLLFQDGVSPHMESLVLFHDKLNSLLLFIGILVLGSLGGLWFYSGSDLNFTEDDELELFWTLIPTYFLVTISIPSLKLLFKEVPYFKPSSTLKIIGHQWYWRYEYFSKRSFFCFDSYMVKDEFLSLGDFRKLEVDLPLFLKVGEWSRILVTSFDVIHRFSLPSFGVKVDAIPGRVNQRFLYSGALGKFYGQCSEICGAKHSFMPISIEVLHL